MNLFPDKEVFIALICELVNGNCLTFPRLYSSQCLLIYSFNAPAGLSYCFKLITILGSEREDFLFFLILLFYGDY
jgi:hypothetical protein